MLEKLLGNKIILIGLLAVIATGVLVATQFGEATKVNIKDSFSSDNPDYKKFEIDINKYLEKGIWNSSSYKTLKNEISNYFNDKLIDIDEKNQLIANLTSKHIVLLTDTIKLFCENISKFESIDGFKNEIESLNNEETYTSLVKAKELVEKYEKLRSNVFMANSYAKNKQYNKYKTDNYFTILEKFTSEDYFKDNQKFQQSIKYSRELLTEQKNLDIDYAEISETYGCNCEEEFIGFQFYVDTCKKIQEIRDSENY